MYLSQHFVLDSPVENLTAPVAFETQSGWLNCSVSSKPVSTITWYKGSLQIAGPERVMNYLSYNISNVSREDAGTYRCKANNGYGGDVNESISFVVHCKYPTIHRKKMLLFPTYYIILSHFSLYINLVEFILCEYINFITIIQTLV